MKASHSRPAGEVITKAEEIEILRRAAAGLGPDSYCGPWLMDQLPCIERDLRSDFPPVGTWASVREEHAHEMDRLKAEREAFNRTTVDECGKLLKVERDKLAAVTAATERKRGEIRTLLSRLLRQLED